MKLANILLDIVALALLAIAIIGTVGFIFIPILVITHATLLDILLILAAAALITWRLYRFDRG